METVEIKDNRHAFITIGCAASGKSTWSRSQFNQHEILNADTYREMLAGHLFWEKKSDKAAFELLNTILRIQAENDVLLCIDNINLDTGRRLELVKFIRGFGYKVHYVLFPDSDNIVLLQERNKQRKQAVSPQIVVSQRQRWKELKYEKLAQECDFIHETPPNIVRSPATVIAKSALVIGDIQGEYPKFRTFLEEHGYKVQNEGTTEEVFVPTNNDTPLISCGDLVDRGSDSVRTLRVVKNMVKAGYAHVVKGNHDWAVQRILEQHLVGTGKRSRGESSQSQQTVQELLKRCEKPELEEMLAFLKSLPPVIELFTDSGEYWISHAGIPYREHWKLGTALLPDKYRYKIINTGYKDGSLTMEGRRHEYFRDSAAYGDATGPKQIHGHINQSEERLGELVVPYVTGKFTALESHVETLAEAKMGFVYV